MSEKLNNNTSDIPTKTEAVIKAPDEWKKVPEVKETQKDTQKKLEDLKKEIQEKGISFDMTKTLLDSLENIEPENRPFILWGIFSWLNHIWISISGIDQDGKIVLHPPKIPFKAEGNFATYEDTLKYNQLFNNYILSGKVSISDVTKWLLYRTSSVDDYIKEKADNSFSTPEYVQRLLKKYKIHVEWNIKDISFWSGAEWKKQFEAFKKDISFAISDNVADKEFLLTYFDDVYYRGGKSLPLNEINVYDNTSLKNQKTVLREISHLNDEQKFALWIRDSNEAKELSRDITKDPIGFLKKNMTADNVSLAIIFWIIWAFLWGKKWFWIWALLWFWVWAGWLAFAQEWWNKLGEKKEQKWNKSPEQRLLTPNQKENSIYSKVTFTTETDPVKRWELEKIWWELSQNDAFLKAPTSILSIFESTPTKTFEEIKTTLKSYDIELTIDNKEHYKTIFAGILSQREKAWIWKPIENETIQEYLERTSKKEDTKVAGVAWVTWSEQKEDVKSRKIDSELQKKELLNYFSINEKDFGDLMKNLDLLWLNLFQLLGWYKNFIETKLTWVDNSIKEKIKHSIKLKTLLINSKIEELQKDDFYKNDFRNNRWIVNNEIKEIFEKTNSLVLPSAYMLTKNPDNKDKNFEEKIKRTREMFDSNLTKDWDFDKTFLSKAWFGEFWDSSRNNWEVFNISDLKDSDWIGNNLNWLSLLNEKDKEIEENAMMWYMAWCGVLIANAWASFTWVWTIPWMVIWSWYSAVDAFKDEDFLISMLKSTSAIPEEFRTHKSMIDNALSLVWAIPLVWPALKAIPLTAKITAFTSKLSPDKLAKFNTMKAELAEKLAEKFPNIFKSWEKWKNIQELEITRFLWKKESLIKSILPKKAGEEVKIWDKAIKKTIEWKFEYNWAKYDKADDIIPVLSRELKDSQIISKINEWWTKNLNKLFAWIDKKEIKIWDDIFRFRIEWKNKILEIKNGNSWTTKSIDELSDWQAQILLDKILWSGIKEKIIWSAREKLESIKINNIISTTERDTIIKRFWKWAWEKISKEFDDFMTKIPSKSDGKSHIYWAERFKEKWFWNAISWLLIWFKEWTWKTMLWWVVTNEIWETYQAGGISQRYENYDIYTDGIDTIMNGILFKKVSLWRAIIAQTIFESTLWNN